MRRAPLPLLRAVGTAGLLLAAGAAACDSTLNLGDAADAALDAGPDTAAPLTCVDTCSRLIYTCHFLDASKTDQCLSECKGAGAALDLQCVQYTPCAAIPSTCGGPQGDGGVPGFDASILDEFDIRVCQSACDSANRPGCISAADLTVCRDRCVSAPGSRRKSYSACSENAASDCVKHQACFELFIAD
jgi:hypothetical protein